MSCQSRKSAVGFRVQTAIELRRSWDRSTDRYGGIRTSRICTPYPDIKNILWEGAVAELA
jgi:hypothetical protein